MGCKFNDSCELLCGINFKAGCEAGLCMVWRKVAWHTEIA
jgi:hypothetical protein